MHIQEQTSSKSALPSILASLPPPLHPFLLKIKAFLPHPSLPLSLPLPPSFPRRPNRSSTTSCCCCCCYCLRRCSSCCRSHRCCRSRRCCHRRCGKGGREGREASDLYGAKFEPCRGPAAGKRRKGGTEGAGEGGREGREGERTYPFQFCSMRCSGSSTLASFPPSPARAARSREKGREGGRKGERDGQKREEEMDGQAIRELDTLLAPF